MAFPSSASVASGDQTQASQYNNLRGDLMYGKMYLQNKSGGAVAVGDVVVFDKDYDTAFTTTAFQGDKRVLGVVISPTIAPDDYGFIASTRGTVAFVNTVGIVLRGQALITSTTPGKAIASGGASQPGLVGFTVTEDPAGAVGQVIAVLEPDLTRAGGQVTLLDSWQSANPVAFVTGTDVAAIPNVNIAAGGGHRFLVVVVCSTAGIAALNSIKLNGAALALAGTGGYDPTHGGCFIGFMVAPPVGGPWDITVNIGQNGSIGVAYAYLFDDVDQSYTPDLTAGAVGGSSDTPSITVACLPGDLTLGAFLLNADSTVTLRPGQTNLNELHGNWNGGSNPGLGVVDEVDPATGNSQTFNWTTADAALWASAAINIRPL